jgi:chemotaxis protein MotA
MFVIIGIAVVILGVLGGFVFNGGPLLVLIQPGEFMIIGAACVGSLLVGTPLAVLKRLIGSMGTILKGDPYGKEQYISLLKTMYELFNVAKRDGLISIEGHITDPSKSAIFKKNEFLLKNHHALDFLCDTMKLILGGGVPAFDLEALLEADIDTHHDEEAAVPTLIQSLGDALPGLGIVAAVLGIVITMQAIDGPPAEVGEKVAAALVGTFLGILMSYGFIQPLAANLGLLNQRSSRYYECMKAGIVAYAKGNAPVVVVEFARRVIFAAVRPSFDEVEKAVKTVKAA